MNDFVALGHYRCPACCKVFESGEVLVAKRLTAKLPKRPVTGWRMCEEHRQQIDAGFTLLAECEEYNASTPLESVRTGRLAAVRGEAFDRVFNVSRPAGGLAMVERGVIDRLITLQAAHVGD